MELGRLVRSSDLHQNGSCHQMLRFWSHLEHQKATRRTPRSSQEAPKKLPRSPQEAPKRLLGGALGALGGPKAPQATILDTFIVFRASKNPPGGPQVTIYRPCRRFRASRRRTPGFDFRLSRTWAGLGRPPEHARARASFHYDSFVSNLNADAPSSPEGRRIIV